MSASWPTVQLGEVLAPVVRERQVDASHEYPLLGVRLDGQGPFHRETVLGTQTSASRLYEVKSGDFIYSRLFAWRGAFGLIEPELDGHFVSNEFPIFAPQNGRVDPKYLKYWFRLPDVLRRVEADCSGSTPLTRNRYKEQYFYALEIPLPPPDEQRRIVERIEALVQKVEEAMAHRSACVEERDALFSKELTNRRRNLSETYPLVALGSLTRVTSGGTPSRDNLSYWGGDIPWIKTGELFDGVIASAEEYITDAGLENSSAKLFPPDTVLIALYGQGQTRGRTGRLAISAATNQACCAVLPCEQLYPQYLQWWFRSLYRELREDAKGGAQPNWSGGMIKDLLIAVPPLARQIEIASDLDTFQSKLGLLAALQTETATELDAMLPAILDKAFKGEL
jgi:type I restriction enzyme, S subunit